MSDRWGSICECRSPRKNALAWSDSQAAAIADATKAGIGAAVEFRYLLLNAAAAALDRDDRERDAATRNREVLATLIDVL